MEELSERSELSAAARGRRLRRTEIHWEEADAIHGQRTWILADENGHAIDGDQVIDDYWSDE